MNCFFTRIFTAFGLFCTVFPAQASLRYEVVNLGYLGADVKSSQAYDINDAGQVVGSSEVGDAFFPETSGFLWTPADGMMYLPSLGGNYSEAFAINESGHVAGVAETALGYTSTIWYSDVAVDIMPSLHGPRRSNYGMDLNDSDQVVGRDYPSAFIWESGIGIRDIGDLPGGSVEAAAYAINNAGQVVGESRAIDGKHAFLWSEGHGMLDLGVLPGHIGSVAQDIDSAGAVVGSSSSGVSDPHAFYWTEIDGMTDLGSLLGGSLNSVAMGMNDQGQIVGWSSKDTPGISAVIWKNRADIFDLNSLIDPASGWHLQVAQAINSSGQIVGRGFYDGALSAFLLNPLSAVPEPASWVMMIAGFALLGHALRCSRIASNRGPRSSISDSVAEVDE